jgi:hypothetical protein
LLVCGGWLDYYGAVLGDETTTILGSPHSERPSGGKRGKEFGPLVSVFVFLPLLAIVGLLQLPVLAVAVPWRRWKHRRFVARMKAQNRVIIWSDFARCIEEKRGTLLIEGSEVKFLHWWWTEEDVRAVSPHPVPERGLTRNRKERRALLPFREWCYLRYTEPSDGRALLVLGEGRYWVDMLENNPDANVVAFQPLSLRLARRARARDQRGRAHSSG